MYNQKLTPLYDNLSFNGGIFTFSLSTHPKMNPKILKNPLNPINIRCGC